MKRLLGVAALLAATVSVSANCAESEGNWYCQAVSAITYTSVGGEGSYNKITNMDSNSGQCSSIPFGYSGSLSPLDEEVSWHIRGPFNLRQFAAYTPGGSVTKKTRRKEHLRRHAHDHRHAKRAVGDMVTATIDGVPVSWINEYAGPSSPTDTVAPVVSTASGYGSSAAASPSANSSASGSNNGSTNGWGRDAYYSSDDQVADGLVFLNHNGGSGSGVFDYTFGNSLSYASSDGQSGASSPQTLANITLPSAAEVVIMTDQECGSEDGGCGYYRPGTVGYHGFDGAEKAFFFEFQMPDDGGSTTDIYDPVNMPALWMLNAQIPRTLQYGDSNCSCWESGCGEFDTFEVLSPGETKAKSTMHGNKAGGDSDYFDRPTDTSIKLAVVMFDNCIHIQVLDSSIDFPETMDSSVVNQILGSSSTASNTVSLFSLADAGSG